MNNKDPGNKQTSQLKQKSNNLNNTRPAEPPA